MRYFINFTLNNCIFDQEMLGSGPIYDVLHPNYAEWVKIAEHLVGYARKSLSEWIVFGQKQRFIEHKLTERSVDNLRNKSVVRLIRGWVLYLISEVFL